MGRVSKWIKGQHVRLDTVKLLEENTGKTFFDINCSNIFFELSPKARETKMKTNKCSLHKLKGFCTAKEIIDEMKKQPIEWEKMFANDMTYKELISKI